MQQFLGVDEAQMAETAIILQFSAFKT